MCGPPPRHEDENPQQEVEALVQDVSELSTQLVLKDAIKTPTPDDDDDELAVRNPKLKKITFFI